MNSKQAIHVVDDVTGRCTTARCTLDWAAGGHLNEVGFGEQHSSNIALAILARCTALYQGLPLSSCQIRQGCAFCMKGHQLHTWGAERVASEGSGIKPFTKPREM